MARVETIVVGGGIGAVAPFALNFVPFVSSTDPASLSSTDFLFVVPTGANRGLIVGTADPAAGPERLRVKGGTILESLSHADTSVIGDGTDSGAAGQILVGNAITPNSQVNSIVIGNAAVGPSGGTGIVIGQASSLQGASGVAINASCSAGGAVAGVYIQATASGGAGSAVAIGSTITTTTAVVSVGMSATVSATSAVQVGDTGNVSASGGIAIGAGASVANVAHTNSIVIGNGVSSFAAQQVNIGTNVGGAPINTVVIGNGVNTIGSPTGVTIRLSNASGADNAAGDLTLVAGLSTGNIATGGNINFQTGEPGASGVVLQTATLRMRIDQVRIRTTLPIRAEFGTAAAPTYSFENDTNSGMYAVADGDLALSVDGVARLRLANPAAGETWLFVYDADNAVLERVSVGAANSGGAGFKLLRIPN